MRVELGEHRVENVICVALALMSFLLYVIGLIKYYASSSCTDFRVPFSDKFWSLKECYMVLKRCASWQPERDGFVVCQLYQNKCFALTRRALFFLAPPLALLLVGHIFIYIFSEHDHYKIRLENGHMPSAWIVMILATAALCHGRQPTTQMVRTSKAIVMMRLAWTVFTYESYHELLFDRQFVLVIRLVAGLAPGDVGFSCLLNSIYSCLASIVFAWLCDRDASDTVLHLGSNCKAYFVMQEFFTTATLLIVSQSLAWQRFAEARSFVELRVARNLEASISRLLRTIYDVVVELDASLCIANSAASLAGMLLHGSNHSLQGVPFTDFLASTEDKERFDRHMAQLEDTDTSQTLANPVQLKMKDSICTVINIEMLHSRFEKLDGTVHHLIGIRETDLNALHHAPVSSYVSAPLEHVENDDMAFVRKSQGALRQGTPARVGKDSLSDATSQASNSCPPTLRFGQKQETTSLAQRTSLLSTLTRWNVQLPKLFCCEYHCLVREALGQIRKMKHAQCLNREGVQPDSEVQCVRCGLLSSESCNYSQVNLCEFCEVNCNDELGRRSTQFEL